MRIALVAERRLSLPWGRPGLSDASFVPIVRDVARWWHRARFGGNGIVSSGSGGVETRRQWRHRAVR